MMKRRGLRVKFRLYCVVSGWGNVLACSPDGSKASKTVASFIQSLVCVGGVAFHISMPLDSTGSVFSRSCMVW